MKNINKESLLGNMATKIQTSTSSKANDVTLVCGADDKFAMPLAVMLFSALVNLRREVTPILYIINGGITETSKQKIEKVLKKSEKEFILHWIPFDLNKLTAVKETNIISKAAYLRVLIPDLLPAEVSKVIYLDCDMIVEADLANLWELKFSEEPAMGVQDFCFPFISTPSAVSNFHKLNIPEDAPYCNSGLIVINVDYWRANNYTSQIFRYLNTTGKELKHFDQDGINVLIAGKWKLLDPRWNVTLSSISNFGEGLKLNKSEVQYFTQKFRSSPFIIHFSSKHKPWHTGNKNKVALNSFYYDQYFIGRFFFYLKKSGWFKPAFYMYWKNYRKAVLLLQYKIPRRIALLSATK